MSQSDHDNSPYKDKVTIRAQKDSIAPLVILFGFATSQVHNLDKFTKKIYDHIEYKGQTCETILLCPTVFQLYSHSNNLKLGSYLWYIINQYCANKRPLFLHVFSGSSFLLHAMFLLLDQNNDMKAKIKQCLTGIIWDSSPIYPDEDVAAKATAPLMDSWKVPRFLWYPLLSYGIIPLYWTYDFGSWTNAHKYRRNYWKKMNDFPVEYDLPQLYIFSTKDTITSSTHIEELGKGLTKYEHMREIVVQKKYEDSIHVQNFKNHTEEYTNDVIEFIFTCLKRYESQEKKGTVFPEYISGIRSKL
jgi:hypothetical protein